MRYKWFGEIPEHWEATKMREIFTDRNTKVSDKDYPALSVGYMGVVPQLDTAAKTNNGDNRKLICKGDFAINSRSDRKGAGGISEYTGSASIIITVLQPHEDINGKFYHYLLRSHYFSEEFYRNGHGLVADLWTTRWDTMRNIYIPVPPRSEQDSIVRYLDEKCSRIDRLLEAYEREVKLLDELKKAAINEAVKGDWRRVRLKYIATLNPYCSHDGLKPEDEVTFAPMECIRTDKRIDRSAPLANYNSSYSSFNEGDIALAKVTPCFQNSNVCLMTNLTNGYAFGSSELFNIRANSIHSKFLLYYFMSAAFIAGGVASMTGVAGLQRVSSEYIRNALVPVPPLSEQQAIAEYLDEKCGKIDMAINLKRRHIKLWQEYKARLISDVVTGQLDIRGVNDNGNRYE